MGNRGRFGKYGDIKRIGRLRRAKKDIAIGKEFVRRGDDGSRPGDGAAFPKMALRLQMAKGSHWDFIIDLSGRVFHEYGPYDKIIQEWLASGMAFTILSVHGRRPVGFAMINLLPKEYGPQDETELLAIAVEPGMQRSGVGQRLIKVVEKKAKALDIKRMALHTGEGNFVARRFFEKAGFTELRTERNFYPKGQNALVMIKDICASIPSPSGSGSDV
ncbi:MAG: GNAT family N-acetyltransferase [Deltaproteobacteria bacterium]|nr:GNAT family N-acetyltransferase [Deltaproteobacteria bacterium]MBW2137744.1 GNAT family N-acetyltransferase [Deltaproteobacteria bacterium]